MMSRSTNNSSSSCSAFFTKLVIVSACALTVIFVVQMQRQLYIYDADLANTIQNIPVLLLLVTIQPVGR
jgi:hypothetical protein